MRSDSVELLEESIDSFSTALQNSRPLSNVEKFYLQSLKKNRLQSFLAGEAQHKISVLSLTNGNYDETLNLLKNRLGTNQVITSAHTTICKVKTKM